MKMVRIIAVLTLILGLYSVERNTYAQEFAKSTDNKIVGYNAELQIAFSAKKLAIH